MEKSPCPSWAASPWIPHLPQSTRSRQALKGGEVRKIRRLQKSCKIVTSRLTKVENPGYKKVASPVTFRYISGTTLKTYEKGRTMGEFATQTNLGRIEKMQGIVAHLAKSAHSNKASAEDIENLFRPLLHDLDGLMPNVFNSHGQSGQSGQDLTEAMETAVREEAQEARQLKPVDPRGPSLLDMARAASMEDLADVVAHYHVRVDDLAFELKHMVPDRWAAEVQPIIDGDEMGVKREERYKQKRGEVPVPDAISEIAEADQADFDEAFEEAFGEEEEDDAFK